MRHDGVVVSGAAVLTLGPDGALVTDGDVVVEGDRIIEIGRHPTQASRAIHEHIDATGCLVLPGLVNTHAHFRPLRAVGDGLGFMDWHDRYVHEFARRMTPEDAYYGAAATFVEMLRNGITTVLGMSSIAVVEPEEVQAAVDTGIRARLVPHAGSRADVDFTIEQVRAQGGSEADRVRIWLGLEVPQLFDLDDFRAVAEASERLTTRVHTHLSEVSRDPLDPFVESGLLSESLSLAHCVHVTDDDIRLMAQHRVGVAHNPRSNMRYGNGVAPVRRMIDAGVAVGLGTDGPDSTYSCDLFEEMRTAALLARVTAQDPRTLSDHEVLNLATRGGAHVLGLSGEIGVLQPGAKADLVVLDLTRPHLVPHVSEGPHANLVPLLVFAARGSDVRDVVVDGRVVVRNRVVQTVDEDAVIRECQARGTRVLATM